MQRPTGITVTAAIMSLSLLIGLIGKFIRPLHDDPAFVFHSQPMTTVFVFLLGTSFIVLYWVRHNWARWFIMLDSIYSLSELHKLAEHWHTSHFRGTLDIEKGLLSIFLLWYLNTPSVRSWFAAQQD